MAIHWKIPFKSLRSGTVYTVNIHDSTYSGDPIVLKGGAQPFTTQEDDNDDMFTPIRTQSGYLRIVDDGKDANGNAFDWKSLIPYTDTSRPITLTSGNTVLWQGFMQSQDFGSTLYGNPQERNFPIQDVLTVTQGTDVDYAQKEMKNFAYLLKQVIDSIPDGYRPTTFVIQGGSHAQQVLMTIIDWQNFVSEDGEGDITARYSMYQLLEDMCRFWGWTARTYGRVMFLTCVDDVDEQSFLTLTYSQLTTMAGGTAAGMTDGTFDSVILTGDIFASMNNNEYVQRGPNKATVTADGNSADENVLFFADSATEDQMRALGFVPERIEDNIYLTRTRDLQTFNRPFSSGSAQLGFGSFNIIEVGSDAFSAEEHDAIHMKYEFISTSATAFASLQTVYHHSFPDGSFTLHGNIYRHGEKFEKVDTRYKDNVVGARSMYMRFGIGPTRASAMWWTGREWSSTESAFQVTIGNSIDTFFSFYESSGNKIWMSHIGVDFQSVLHGLIFIEFLGSDDINRVNDLGPIPVYSGDRIFDITEFSLTYERQQTYNKNTEIVRSDRRSYVSKNQNSVRGEWNADCIFASENNMSFGFGVLYDSDYSFMDGMTYGSSTALVYPEQHLADRVTSFWTTNKRRLRTELRSNAISDITPQTKVTIDGTTTTPIAFGREWRDDVTIITFLELPNNS